MVETTRRVDWRGSSGNPAVLKISKIRKHTATTWS
ncbi:hypothetical protein COLO4_15630 [Corchorus olitorius]|uniref:Uncharacterized protein n=1 Tax=Corchorus olitorius TaxID=93759 RepID=A0A1R3JLZ1_9ROSI|nr:hypothetical protein COLO4_15630 [Corchorus olitorius]